MIDCQTVLVWRRVNKTRENGWELKLQLNGEYPCPVIWLLIYLGKVKAFSNEKLLLLLWKLEDQCFPYKLYASKTFVVNDCKYRIITVRDSNWCFIASIYYWDVTYRQCRPEEEDDQHCNHKILESGLHSPDPRTSSPDSSHRSGHRTSSFNLPPLY